MKVKKSKDDVEKLMKTENEKFNKFKKTTAKELDQAKKVFFDKEDQASLRKLLKKLQEQEKQVKAEDETASKHEQSLRNLFKQNKIEEDKNQELFKDLLEWRKKI